MPECIIALGGNVGDVRRTFSNFCVRLDEDDRISLTKKASCYRTQAVGSDADDSYWNSAIEIETSLLPLELLELLQLLENEYGRSSKGDDGPRTLDLDLVFYGREILSLPGLTVPHSACWYRRFVLDPVCEIAPKYYHPVKKVNVSRLRERLLFQPFRLGIAGGAKTDRQLLCEVLRAEFAKVEISAIETLDLEDIDRQTIVAWLGREDCSRGNIPFEELPLVSRLDLSPVQDDPSVFLKNVLDSALAS